MNDNLYFITKDEIVDRTPMNQHVPDSELNLCIENAVDLYLGQALSEIKSTLLIAIKAKNDSSSGTITTENQAIWDHLKQPLAWFVYYHWLITYGRGKVTKKGMVAKVSGDMEVLSSQDASSIEKNAYNTADTFLGNFNTWLDDQEIDKGSDELDSSEPLLDWGTVKPDI